MFLKKKKKRLHKLSCKNWELCNKDKRKILNKRWINKNKNYFKDWRNNNKSYYKIWYANNREKCKLFNKQYNEKKKKKQTPIIVNIHIDVNKVNGLNL